MVWFGVASQRRLGEAGSGVAGQGMVWKGEATQARRGWAWQGRAGRVPARQRRQKTETGRNSAPRFTKLKLREKPKWLSKKQT